MCTDHGLSRRSLLRGSAALGAGAILVPPRVPAGRRPLSRLPLRSAMRPQNTSGDSAYSMAMHVHSSFSEFSGSMDAQCYQATANGVDVLWWTDHDQRMTGLGYRDQVHFTSLTNEKGAAGQGGAWHWEPQQSGPLTSSGGGIVQAPCSPSDPVAGGALHVTAKSASAKTAKYGFWADCQTADYNYRDSLQGQSVSVDVLLSPGWTRGYLEILIGSSYHQASAGRPAGLYSLSYRVRPGTAAPRSAEGSKGIVHVSAAADGNWHTITITPQADIAALWPDLDSRDFGLFAITLSAVSTGDDVGGYFDWMTFDRTVSGEVAFQNQAEMMTALGPKYPAVTQQQGLELSAGSGVTHVNWFGPDPQILDYAQMTPALWNAWLAGQAIPQIHAGGGLASYNHPYGVGSPVLSQAQMDAALTTVATSLLGSRALGADLLETGYPQRGGADLAHHVALWDVLSRNAVFLTGTGVNDDHIGEDWLGDLNNWATSAWAATSAQADLLAALAAGRAWCGSLSGFALPSGAALDLVADGTCPMGSVSLSSLTTRQLTVTCTGLPAGGCVQVVQGAVDYAGTGDPEPDTAVIASYDASTLDGNGQATQAVDTSSESFVRTQVLDASGNVVALSNPVWMLSSPPPNGIPPARAT